MPRDNRCMYMMHVCFYVGYSDSVGVCENVCCVPVLCGCVWYVYCYGRKKGLLQCLQVSKIVRSALSEATCRWLSNYIRGRQSVSSCRGVKSKAMIVHTGVPQGSKMSPILFSFI